MSETKPFHLFTFHTYEAYGGIKDYQGSYTTIDEAKVAAAAQRGAELWDFNAEILTATCSGLVLTFAFRAWAEQDGKRTREWRGPGGW